ncbi:MAG TPA: hypothetical protein P5290_05835 [Candidatus Methanomethylicus sp.]|nr:hypothetical protein [Candidatus Methanomethylicus sp.]
MTKSEDVFKATISPKQRAMVDKIKEVRGTRSDAELIRALVFDEAKRLNIIGAES